MISVQPILNLFSGKPLLAILEVCLRCNSACGYCDLPLNKGRYEMSREEIQDMFAKLYKEGLRFVFVQGGEPLVRRDLLGILEDLHKIGFGITLITNGTRLSEKFVTRLAELPINISISLDTLNRERYKSIRGADQLPMVLEGLQRLSDYPHPKYITCIVSEQNYADVEEVAHFAKDEGFIPVIGAYHWGVGRYGREDPTLRYQRNTAADLFKNVLDSGVVPRGYFREYLKDNIKWLTGGSLGACDAGRYSIAIDCSGNVAPCLALNHAGNLRETTLTEILNNFDKQEINECSSASSCNMLCSRVVSSALRKPLRALSTPKKIAKQRKIAYSTY